MTRRSSRSLELGLGTRLLLIVLVAAVVPLAFAGTWLTRDAGRAGEELLVQRMDETLLEVARDVGALWIRSRTMLLDLAESPEVSARLTRQEAASVELAAPPADVTPLAAPAALAELVLGAEVLGRDGRAVARFAAEGPPRGWAGLPVRVPIHAPLGGEALGWVEARLRLDGLLARAPEWTARSGGVLGILEPGGAASVLPTPFDPHLLAEPTFTLGGEEWVTVRHALAEPPAVLVLAAPVDPFTEPFREAARRGVLLILAVAATGFAVTAVLTRQVTRPLHELAEASRAVASGDLDRRVEVGGPAEIRQLARTFNSMAGSLRSNLDALSKREALAAVGEFASALAHELRNPLTAMRLDLQRIDEVSDDDARRGALMERMLASIRRLDRTVSGVLRVAGSGGIRLRTIPVGEPLERALETARPILNETGAEIRGPIFGNGSPLVQGDPEALEQLFLNLLVNAAEALEEGGPRRVEVEVRIALPGEDDPEGSISRRARPAGAPGDDWILVHIRDTGKGIPPEDRERIFEPMYSTKKGGTGLGLVIADRVARAHGGGLSLESRPGEGTVVTIRLRSA